jgi:TatD DNase family protein
VLLIDTHVHTNDEQFTQDLSQILTRARRAGVAHQVVPAVLRNDWEDIKSLCSEHTDLHPCYGLHPCFIDQHKPEHLAELARWLGREQPAAVGECGLDYSQSVVDKDTQMQFFSGQLALAREFRLPIVVHAHKAVEDVILAIRAAGHHHGLIHSFNGSQQQAHRLLDLGYKLSFGGAITYTRARRLRKLVSKLPADSFVLETDAPYQPSEAFRGQRAEPAHLTYVLNTLSELRTESLSELAAQTTHTACKLFNLPQP